MDMERDIMVGDDEDENGPAFNPPHDDFCTDCAAFNAPVGRSPLADATRMRARDRMMLKYDDMLHPRAIARMPVTAAFGICYWCETHAPLRKLASETWVCEECW